MPCPRNSGSKRHIDDLDAGTIGIDDDPTHWLVVDDHDLLVGPRMLEPDRHRLGAELHANQTVEHLRAQRAQVVTRRCVQMLLERSIGGDCLAKLKGNCCGHRVTVLAPVGGRPAGALSTLPSTTVSVNGSTVGHSTYSSPPVSRHVIHRGPRATLPARCRRAGSTRPAPNLWSSSSAPSCG